MGLCYRVGELDAGGRKCMAYWMSGPTESIVGIHRQMANDVYRGAFCGESRLGASWRPGMVAKPGVRSPRASAVGFDYVHLRWTLGVVGR